MNGIRRVLGVLVGVVLMALAGATLAAQPDKIFVAQAMKQPFGTTGATIGLPTKPADIAPDGTAILTFTNISPTGNSAVNSITITPPAGGKFIPLSSAAVATVVQDGDFNVATTAIDSSGNLKLNSFQGLLPQNNANPPHSLQVTFKVVPTSGGSWGTACSSLTFGVQAFTGNSFNGTTFQLVDLSGNPISPTISEQLSTCVTTYTLTYTAGAYGTINGTTPQTVYSGNSGTAVTAVSNTGYHFVNWSDMVATATRIDTNVTANLSVTANFAINTYQVTSTVDANGHGTITPSGTQTVNYGVARSFTLTPATGYHVDTVTGCGGTLSADKASYTTGPVAADCTVTASFAINTYQVTSTVDASGHGTITPSGTQTVNYNATSSFTLTPATGYHVDTVTGCGGTLSADKASYTTGPVTADCAVTASFAINTYTVTPSAGSNGAISPATAQTVNYNATPSFTLTPATGYHVGTVTGCGGTLSADKLTYTTGPVTADCTVTASFAIDAFTIGGEVSGLLAPYTTVVLKNGGDSVEVPNGSFTFPTQVTYGGSYSVTVLTQPKGQTCTVSGGTGTATGNVSNAVTVQCTPNSYQIKSAAGGGGTISPLGTISVAYPASPSYVITANSGYSILDVVVDGVSKGNIGSYTFPNVSADHKIEALFTGPLNCQPNPPFTFDASDPTLGSLGINVPGYAVGQRGPFNKDGSQCVPVVYTFTNKIVDSNKVRMWWDSANNGQQGAAFLYTLTWKPQWVDPTTGMPKMNKTRLAWAGLDANDHTLIPADFDSAWVDGRACLAMNTILANPPAVPSFLPSPYGTLVDNYTANGTSIRVLAWNNDPAYVPLSVPFPITIGNERMTVTAMTVDPSLANAFIWTVVPHVGGTIAANHSANARVMSNPLPLYTDTSVTPPVARQMQMCIAEEGWSNVPAGNDFDYPGATDCTYAKLPNSYKNPDPDTGLPGIHYNEPLTCAMFTTTIYDIGDGAVFKSP